MHMQFCHRLIEKTVQFLTIMTYKCIPVETLPFLIQLQIARCHKRGGKQILTHQCCYHMPP